MPANVPAKCTETRRAKEDGDVEQELAEFGVPKSKRGARLHVVDNRPSVSRTGKEPRIENLAPERWTPRYPCSMTLDRALREMEFPSRLAGAAWTVGE